jgi:C1A family cysteine protease
MPKPNFRSIRKAAVIKDADGKQLSVGGYRADQKRDNTQKYCYNNPKKLPQAVDLRPYLTPIENQGASNSCTANATAGAHEYLLKRLKGQEGDVSRLFIYYNARKLDGAIQVDEGSYLQSCVGVLREYGACSEKTWPFDLDRILDVPHANAYDEATAF